MDEKNTFGDASFEDLAKKYLNPESDTSAGQATPDPVRPEPPANMQPPKPPAAKEEVYFSNQFARPQPPAEGRRGSMSSVSQMHSSYMDDNMDLNLTGTETAPIKEEKTKKEKRNFFHHRKGGLLLRFDPSKFTKSTYIFFGVVIALSVVISVYSVFCVNDILAISKSKNSVPVSVSETDIKSVNSVINMLHDNKLINCPTFCKIFVRVRSGMFVKNSKGEPIEYTQGTFDLNSKMGLEGLLVTLQGEVAEKEEVQLTFPEGFTIPEIIDKLVENQVCDRDALKAELEKATYTYSILNGFESNEQIPYKFEGYLFPDTYDFYQGENPNSVIEKFIKALDQNFTQEMRQQAANMNLSIRQVLILASIIQKEAANDEQMKTISSIMHNRLKNPTLFPSLGCDSTADYIIKKVGPSLTANSPNTADYYKAYYDTYDILGLPPGPISNPGMAAIEAVLYPAQTDLFFFCHDKNGKMYTASNLAQHNVNVINSQKVS